MFFNGTNAALYINDVYVTDALTFEYSENKQKLPVYGYKSVTWDTVLIGNSVIQGSFSVNFSDTHDLELYLRGGEGSLDDTAFTPPVKGNASWGRNFFTIKLIYADKEFVKKDKDGAPLSSSLYPTSYTGPTTDPASYWGKMVQQGEYKYKDFFSVIEITKASIHRVTQSIVADANPIGEYYEFIARDVMVSGA